MALFPSAGWAPAACGSRLRPSASTSPQRDPRCVLGRRRVRCAVRLDVRSPVDIRRWAASRSSKPRKHGGRRAADRIDGVQLADLREREPERLQPVNESEALELVGAVDAAPARLRRTPGKQSDLFVITHGARREPRPLTDSRRWPTSDDDVSTLPAHVNCKIRSPRRTIEPLAGMP